MACCADYYEHHRRMLEHQGEGRVWRLESVTFTQPDSHRRDNVPEQSAFPNKVGMLLVETEMVLANIYKEYPEKCVIVA